MLEFTVIGGVDKGRTLRSYYNYEHTSEEAQRISREQICAAGAAIGLQSISIPEGLDQFIGKTLRLKTYQKPGSDWPEIKQVEAEKKADQGFSDLEAPTPPGASTPDPWA